MADSLPRPHASPYVPHEVDLDDVGAVSSEVDHHLVGERGAAGERKDLEPPTLRREGGEGGGRYFLAAGEVDRGQFGAVVRERHDC